MPIDRSEQFQKRKSDAMRLISGAIEKAKEAPEPEIVEALAEEQAKPIIKAPSKKPKRSTRGHNVVDEKERRNKRVTLYMTEDEYDMFREQAFRRRKTMNELIITAAKKNIGRPPAAPKKYTETAEQDNQ